MAIRDEPLTSDLLALLAISPAVTYIRECSNRYPLTFLSDNVGEFLGFVPDAFLRDESFWIERVHSDDRAAALDIFDALFETGDVCHEYRMLHEDGAYRLIRDVLKLDRDAAGQPVKIIGCWTDITRRKQTERILHDSEKRFKDFAEASADWFWEMDAELRFTYMSPNVEEIVGVAPEWHYGKTREELLGDDYDQAVWRDHLDALKAHEPFRNFVYRRVGKGVEAMWLSASGVPVFDADGSFLGYRGSGSDATVQKKAEEALRQSNAALEKRVEIRTTELKRELVERKQAETALRESEAQMRLVTDSLPVLIAQFDRDFNYVFLNKTGADWYGVPAGGSLGHPMEIFGKQSESWREEMEEALSGNAVSYEREIAYPDGVTRGIRGIYVPNIDAHGTVTGIFALSEDVTKHNELERQLRRSQELEAVGQVTGGVAHEFNNLLMMITGNLDLLIEEHLEDMPEVCEKVERVLKHTFIGKELTNRLLSYTGNPFDKPENLDVGEAIDGVVKFLRSVLGEEIRIATELAPELWGVKVDPREFKSALTNLALNAQDAMPQGGEIEIKAANTTLDEKFADARPYEVIPGDYVSIAIRDKGAGMSPEVVERAFDPFFTTKGVGEGTGLGLSMVYGFVHRQSGGYVDIETKEGMGTTITLYFPRSLSGAGNLQDASEADLPVFKAKTVLLVEDDADVRDMLVGILESSNYRVIPAADGTEALRVLSSIRTLDLMLADIVLPGGMDGVELGTFVQDKWPDAKIIYISGYAEAELMARGVPARHHPMLAKPFRKDYLLNAVENAFG